LFANFDSLGVGMSSLESELIEKF